LTFGGPGGDVLNNGSFEMPDGNNSGAANWNSGANTTHESVWVTNQWDTLLPVSGTNLLFMQGTTASVSPAAPNTFLTSDWFPVDGGLSYHVKFQAANPVKVGGANPQYRVRFYNAANGFLTEQWRSFASAGVTWTEFSVTNTAPVDAAFMELFFIQAVGAGADWNWVTLIDDVSVNSTTSFGPINVLTPTVTSGVSFVATVQTNGATAADATGSVYFQTNSVGLSTNGVSVGSATSANAILLPPYTVTAIYSGDGQYIGSTNTLTVNTAEVIVTLDNLNQVYDGSPRHATATTIPAGFTVAFTYDGSPNAPINVGTYEVIGTVVDNDYFGSATNNLVIIGDVSTTPTNMTFSISGDQLILAWPESHLGWILQTQTNDLSVGIADNWEDVTGSETNTQWIITIDPSKPTVFFRLRLP
jgi:hypothetical protein